MIAMRSFDSGAAGRLQRLPEHILLIFVEEISKAAVYVGQGKSNASSDAWVMCLYCNETGMNEAVLYLDLDCFGSVISL